MPRTVPSGLNSSDQFNGGSGLAAEYYNNRRLTNESAGKLKSFSEPGVNGQGRPGPGVSMKRKTNRFSFRSAYGSGYGFGRYRHKPVARSWRKSRKRFTATVACINTALIGYIIGVYVSSLDCLLGSLRSNKA